MPVSLLERANDRYKDHLDSWTINYDAPGQREAGRGEDALAEHDRPSRDGWQHRRGVQRQGFHPGGSSVVQF